MQKIEISEFKAQNERLVFISKSGYTSAAIEFAKQHDIELLDGHLKLI